MKYIESLQEFLNKEIGEYSWDYEIDFDDECEGREYYSVKITDKYNNGKKIGNGTVEFVLSEGKIEVCVYEDHYEAIEYFEWTVKYFWMALLVI